MDLSQRTLSFLVAALLLAPVSTFAAAVDTATESQGAVAVQLPAAQDELPQLPPVKPLLEQKAAAEAEELPAIPAIPESSPNIFLLQLGAFPNEAQASSYWNKLKERHSELLGDLELKISPVSLPPDNKVTYRTQAGFIASREKAQSICARLRSTGADCFLVESVPGAPAAPVETKTEQAALPAIPEPTGAAPGDQDKPWETVTAEPAPKPSPVPVNKETAAAVPVELNDPNPVTEPVAVPETAHVLPPVAAKASAPETLKEAPKPAPKQETVEAPAWREPVAPITTPAPQPAPKAPVQSAAKAKSVKVAAAPKPQPNRTLIASADSATVRTLGGGVPAQTSPAPIAEPVTQIPPRMPQEFTPAPPELSAPPAELAAPHDIAPQTTAAAVNRNPNARGEVEVAEAIRVPLSQESQPVPGKLVYRVMPSDPQRTRTQWLDLGVFASESQAVGYWNELRATYAKNVTGLRVRVTRPFMNPGRTSLRVGPLSDETDTASICTVATEQGLHCNVVTDLGVSSSSTRGGMRVSREDIATETYYRQSQPTRSSGNMYWVQLGTFPSEGEAMRNWSALQGAYGDLLGRLQQNITIPRLSSASRQMYRLRTGPFLQRFIAAELCDNLRHRGASCVTVQGN